jgi:hypothetical protein
VIDRDARRALASHFEAFLSGEISSNEFVERALTGQAKSIDPGVCEIRRRLLTFCDIDDFRLTAETKIGHVERERYIRIALFLAGDTEYAEWPPPSDLGQLGLTCGLLVVVGAFLWMGYVWRYWPFLVGGLAVGFPLSWWIVTRLRRGSWKGDVRRGEREFWPFRSKEESEEAFHASYPKNLP